MRELIDGSVGHQPRNANLASSDRDWWQSYQDRLERVAQEVGKDWVRPVLPQAFAGRTPGARRTTVVASI